MIVIFQNDYMVITSSWTKKWLISCKKMKILQCCILMNNSSELGRGKNGTMWCRSADPEVACVFLGQTSREHTHTQKKNCNHLEQLLSERLSYPSPISLCTTKPVSLCGQHSAARKWGAGAKYYNCCANKKQSSHGAHFVFHKVSSVKRQQQKLEIAYAALVHPD